MNVSWKKTSATPMQPVLTQLAVMSVLAMMDSKEMASPTAQVSFHRNVPTSTWGGGGGGLLHFMIVLVYLFSNESRTGFECSAMCVLSLK